MNILKKINSWAVLIALFTCGAAFAITPSNPSAPQNYVEWGQPAGGEWKIVEPGDFCDASPVDPCTVNFPEGQDPNDNASGGIPGPERGQFVPGSSAN